MYPSKYMYDTNPCKGPFEVRKPLKQEDELVGQISVPDNWNTLLVVNIFKTDGCVDEVVSGRIDPDILDLIVCVKDKKN